MTNFQANTTLAVYRSVAVADETYGVGEDVNMTPVASGLPASVQEGWFQGVREPQSTSLPASLRGGVVEYFTIRVRPLTDVQEGDRLHDERYDLWFQVVEVVRPYSIVGYADVRVGVTRIDSVSHLVDG